MNWVLGFRELGWDVWVVENIAAEKLSTPEPGSAVSPEEEFFVRTAAEFGLGGRATLFVDGESAGAEAFRAFAEDADWFVNYSGQFHRLDLLAPRTRKFYLDVDPAFTQLWTEVCGSDMNLAGHEVFLTVGTNLNGADACLPKAGREWIPLPPPVAGAFWRSRLGAEESPAADASWTTIGHWYGYPEMEWQGRRFGGKRESFLALCELPQRVPFACGLATDLAPDWDDYALFADRGWQFFSARDVCRDIPTYLHFIASSRGEIGVAKTGYIVSRGGWLSDRGMIYLALGRPVLQQNTGWTGPFPSDKGLVAFDHLDDAAAALRAVEENYAAHCAAARRLADEVFSARAVISRLIDQVG
jgi:hypothetical protein